MTINVFDTEVVGERQLVLFVGLESITFADERVDVLTVSGEQVTAASVSEEQIDQ